MRPLEHFLIQFGITRFDSDSDSLFIQDNKYYIISRKMEKIIRTTKNPFYIGEYLGKARGKKFFPSVNLLNRIKGISRNKVWIDKKTEWLFICGRDLFGEGITKATKNVHKGIITLVLNEKDEVLGFGKAVKALKSKDVVIDHIFDIGDFLRREKK